MEAVQEDEVSSIICAVIQRFSITTVTSVIGVILILIKRNDIFLLNWAYHGQPRGIARSCIIARNGAMRCFGALPAAFAAASRHSKRPVNAYSDGSVTGRGVAGSAAIVIETPAGEVVATVRLAPTDVALSSGRTEWVGLVMVLIAAASCPAKIELRLDNIQVVNTFNDGRRKYVRDWLKRTDRDVASLAWSLAEERERRDFGGL